MIGITRHRAIDEIRSRRHKSRQREIPSEDAPAAMLSDSGNLEQQVALEGDVRSALGLLPSVQRQAIELAYYGGLSSTEIASSLGMPVGTVKTRLRLGLTKLRAVLLPGWEADESGEE